MALLPDKNPDDLRAKTVGKIWGSAVGMLAICIPLCAVLKSAVIPIAVIMGAAVVTFYIWNSGEKDGGSERLENEALKARLKELEERLANVEVINRFEDRLAEKQLRGAEERAGKTGDAAPLPPPQKT